MKTTKSKKLIAGVLAASAIMSIGATAFAAQDDSGIQMEIRQFRPDFKFNIQSSDIDYNGGVVDFKKDLGIRDENSNEFRLHVGDSLRLSYTKLGYSGNSTLSQQLIYDGQVFSATANIDSKFDMKYYRASLIRPLSKSDVIETKWMIDVKGFDIKSHVSGEDSLSHTYVTASHNITGAIPTIGVAINAKLDKGGNTEAFAEISGLPLGKYGHFYDAEAGIKYNIDKTVAINAGYRIFDISLKDPDSDEKARFKLSGPFINASYKF